jgi:hypothetical protein
MPYWSALGRSSPQVTYRRIGLVFNRKTNDHPQTINQKAGKCIKNLKINWHPEPNVIAMVISINNVNVRLTEERWLHIVEYHRELVNFQLEVLLTIAEPDRVYFSPTDMEPNFVAVKVFDRLADFGLAKNLTVHYKEAFSVQWIYINGLCNSDKRLKKRFRLWQRLK